MVVSMERWVGKVAVVTGASSGIGAAIAKQLVEEGLLVVGVARRKERIETLAKSLTDAKGKLYSFKADLSKEEEIKECFKWTTENIGPVSILINNAACAGSGGLIDGDSEAWKLAINVNLLGLCIATKEAIRIMRKNNIDGHIVHINSILGHKVINLPNVNVYPATKHAVTALTEILRNELNVVNSKIKISSVSPGLVDTEILDNLRNLDAFKEFENYLLKSEDIADGVVYILSTPPHVQVHDLMIKPVGEKF